MNLHIWRSCQTCHEYHSAAFKFKIMQRQENFIKLQTTLMLIIDRSVRRSLRNISPHFEENRTPLENYSDITESRHWRKYYTLEIKSFGSRSRRFVSISRLKWKRSALKFPSLSRFTSLFIFFDVMLKYLASGIKWARVSMRHWDTTSFSFYLLRTFCLVPCPWQHTMNSDEPCQEIKLHRLWAMTVIY